MVQVEPFSYIRHIHCSIRLCFFRRDRERLWFLWHNSDLARYSFNLIHGQRSMAAIRVRRTNYTSHPDSQPSSAGQSLTLIPLSHTLSFFSACQSEMQSDVAYTVRTLLFYRGKHEISRQVYLLSKTQVNQNDLLKESSLQITFTEIWCITKGKLAENKRHFGV